MAWVGSAVREHHGPGYVGHAAPQLAVHEIGEPAEEEADRRRAGDQIAQAKEWNSVRPGEQYERRDDAQQPAMERHAALPDFDDVERVREILQRLIEEHDPQP